MLKEMDADALIEAIKIVADGGSYLHPKVTHNLVNEYRRLANEERRGNQFLRQNGNYVDRFTC